jgi:hypothetical protein
MDENIIFVALVAVFLIFIIQKQPRLVAVIVFIILAYVIFKSRFTNPREFINYMSSKITETFESCSMNNQSYCGDSVGSNMTILPDILRSAPIGNNSINDVNTMILKAEDYQIDKRMKMGIQQITIDDLIAAVPVLLDYKMYLEKVIKFTLGCKSDYSIQKDFLAKKLRFKMTKIFYNAYNTVTDKKYPIQTYNELLYSERDFNDTLNIYVFLALDDDDTYKLSNLQKEFHELNRKLNQFVIDKVNDISPNDYNITSSRLPQIDEPQGINAYNNNDSNI